MTVQQGEERLLTHADWPGPAGSCTTMPFSKRVLCCAAIHCAVLQLKADYGDLRVMYPNDYGLFCKSLRYGAALELVSVRTLS